MARPKVWVELERSGQRFVIRCPYSKEWVEAFKTRIPYHEREWDAGHRVWAVTRGSWPHARDLLRQHFGEECLSFGPAAEAALTEKMVDDLEDPDMEAYAVLGVRVDAPECVIHASWAAIEDAKVGAGANVYVGDLPDLRVARIAYERVCKHRGATPVHPAASTVKP